MFVLWAIDWRRRSIETKHEALSFKELEDRVEKSLFAGRTKNGSFIG